MGTTVGTDIGNTFLYFDINILLSDSNGRND